MRVSMRLIKNQPRRDLLKANHNPLMKARCAADLTQDAAIALYRKRIGPISRRTWQYWEEKNRKRDDIPPGAFLIFKR